MARRLYRTQRSQHISNPSAPRLSSIDIFTGKVLIEEPLGRFVYHLQIPMSRFVEREESSSSFAIPYRRDGETLQGSLKCCFEFWWKVSEEPNRVYHSDVWSQYIASKSQKKSLRCIISIFFFFHFLKDSHLCPV